MKAPTAEATVMPQHIAVTIDGQMFTALRAEGFAKPILYPVLGPGGIDMTRHYPMREVEGEADDHPHHKSLWYTHGDVNGIDFWSEGEGRGRIRQDSSEVVQTGKVVSIHATDSWIGPDDEVILRDKRVYTFSGGDDWRAIDLTIELQATEGPVTFGDTKEGTMGIRTTPALRLNNDERRGVTSAAGEAVNSEGVTGRDVWGKRARWVHYQAPHEDRTIGVAIFDHPDNPRYPTWWHARDYGLIAANPFGVHDFEGADDGTGDMMIPEGESVTFRYRFLFLEGDAMSPAGVEQRWRSYAEPTTDYDEN